jgi:AcrB/AcrD/AcrF family
VPRDQAIHDANLVRLRPILMTTVTLIAGMIPIALGRGPGASSRASMAKVIIGGQALSLVITLLIVPVAYALFDDATAFLREQLPVGVRERRAWAWLMACGAGSLAAALLLGVCRILADLPPVVAQVNRLFLLGGLAAFALGWVTYRIVRRNGRRQEPVVLESAS